MRKRRIIIIGLAGVVAIMQLIRPERNYSDQVYQDMAEIYNAPDTIRRILKRSCTDCHSNNTRYPWYAEVQPFGWFLDDHIRKGKKDLNLDEFAEYSNRKKISKLKSMRNQVRDDEMPLTSYSFMHKDARLSDYQKNQLIDWFDKIRDSLKTEYNYGK